MAINLHANYMYTSYQNDDSFKNQQKNEETIITNSILIKSSVPYYEAKRKPEGIILVLLFTTSEWPQHIPYVEITLTKSAKKAHLNLIQPTNLKFCQDVDR